MKTRRPRVCLTWWHFSLQEPLMHPAVIESWLESTHKSFVWQIQLAQPYQEVHVRYTIATSHEHVNGGTKMCSIVAWQRFQITWIHLRFHNCTRFHWQYATSWHQSIGNSCTCILLYHIAGKFGKSSAIHQTKTIQSMVFTINNPLANLFIRQTFSDKCLKIVNSPNILPTKLSRYTDTNINISHVHITCSLIRTPWSMGITHHTMAYFI